MKKIKQIDAMVSLAMIIVFGVVILIVREPEYLMTGYLVVGGWQVLSMLAHAILKWNFVFPGERTTYHWITFLSLATFFLGSAFLLIFLAPIMAIYYDWLCFRELRKLNSRPIEVLK